jgi:hypothetical protein
MSAPVPCVLLPRPIAAAVSRFRIATCWPQRSADGGHFSSLGLALDQDRVVAEGQSTRRLDDRRVGLYAGDCFLPIGDHRLKLETTVDLGLCCWSPSIMMSQLLTC